MVITQRDPESEAVLWLKDTWQHPWPQWWGISIILSPPNSGHDKQKCLRIVWWTLPCSFLESLYQFTPLLAPRPCLLQYMRVSVGVRFLIAFPSLHLPIRVWGSSCKWRQVFLSSLHRLSTHSWWHPGLGETWRGPLIWCFSVWLKLHRKESDLHVNSARTHTHTHPYARTHLKWVLCNRELPSNSFLLCMVFCILFYFILYHLPNAGNDPPLSCHTSLMACEPWFERQWSLWCWWGKIFFSLPFWVLG